MGRVSIDCRDFPDGTNCTVALSADTADELIEECGEHVMRIHGAKADTPELRAEIRSGFKVEE